MQGQSKVFYFTSNKKLPRSLQTMAGGDYVKKQMCAHVSTSVAGAPAVLDHGIRADPKSFFYFLERGRGEGRGDGGQTRQQTCVEKHFDSCKLSVYVWFSTGAPPLYHAGGLPSSSVPRPSVSTLTSESGYTSVTDLFLVSRLGSKLFEHPL